MLRHSLDFESIEILGGFHKKLGNGFELSSLDPDYSFSYLIKLNNSLQHAKNYSFQLVCLYIDNFNNRYLRIINYTISGTNDIAEYYFSLDIDTLLKIYIMKEIQNCYISNFTSSREGIKKKLINILYHYRDNVIY